MPSTTVLLVTGASLDVEGSIEDVAKEIENAMRSSAGAVAWCRQSGTGAAIALNPSHVVTLTPTNQ